MPGDRRSGVRVASSSARPSARLMPPPVLDGFELPALAQELSALGADGWLLYDFRKLNPIAGRILGDTGMGTRRLFVLLPHSGRPVALAWVGSEAAGGAEVGETGVQQRVLDAMGRAGLWTNDGPIVAFGPTSAMPHYEPHPGADRHLAAGDVVLLDLWAGPGKGSVFADQTWMGVAGRSPDADVRRGWEGGEGGRRAPPPLPA